MPVIYIYAINTTAGRDNKLYESPIYRWSIFASTSSCVDQIHLASFSLWPWIIIITKSSPGSQAGRKSITLARSILRATPIRNTGLWEGLPCFAISNKMKEKRESIIGNIYLIKLLSFHFRFSMLFNNIFTSPGWQKLCGGTGATPPGKFGLGQKF